MPSDLIALDIHRQLKQQIFLISPLTCIVVEEEEEEDGGGGGGDAADDEEGDDRERGGGRERSKHTEGSKRISMQSLKI